MNTKFWSLNLAGKDPMEDLGLDGPLMLNLILKLWGGRVQTRLIWLWLRVSGRCCEHDNEPSSSIKGDNISWLDD